GDRLGRLAPDALQLEVHGLARHRVERAERLVHQQQRGVVDQRAGQRHALPHASRQLVRILVLESGEADQRQELARASTIRRPVESKHNDGSITLSSTVRHGSSTGSWNTIPTLRLGPLMRRPSSSTLPDEAERRPPRMRSNVVFPQPEGPTIVTNSPSAMLSVTSASARIREPARVRYVFSTRETAINGAPIPGIWCGAGPSRARGDRRSTV